MFVVCHTIQYYLTHHTHNPSTPQHQKSLSWNSRQYLASHPVFWICISCGEIQPHTTVQFANIIENYNQFKVVKISKIKIIITRRYYELFWHKYNAIQWKEFWLHFFWAFNLLVMNHYSFRNISVTSDTIQYYVI